MACQPLLVVIAVAVVALLVVGFAAYYESTAGTRKNPGSPPNTYITSCSITGVGGFEFQVVSSTTGAPISGENITAVDRVDCGGQNQVVYLDSFSESKGGGGWLVPDYPIQAIPAGQLVFTIAYQGGTYSFTAYVPPFGTNCVTFQIHSGNTTSTAVMNGSGSYCSQG